MLCLRQKEKGPDVSRKRMEDKMSENQSYPPYGKPQSDWQPFMEGETQEIPEQHTPASESAFQQGYATKSETAKMPPAYQANHARYATPQGQPVQAYDAQPAKKKSGVKAFLISFAGAAVACILVLGLSLGTGLLKMSVGSTTANSSGTSLGASTSTTITTSEDTTLAEVVAAKALPSVVSISVYTQTTSSSLYGFGLGGLGSSDSSSSSVESSLGSGVVLSEDGYVITNYHVIEGASALKVTCESNTYDADIVGYDSSSDIAVIKLRNASGLTPIELGDSSNLTVGEWVMSIGSPFGLEQSVATGVVSATERSQIYSESSSSGNGYGYGYGNSGSSGYMLYVNMIQTDAAINPGNSGGALVDKNGQLIGINTLITSYSGNYSGVGFAIPANYAIQLAQQIINGETPTHAQLGVTLSSVTSSIANRYGLAVDSGAYVTSVSNGTGASDAGIQQGDIITKFDDRSITSASDLMLAVRTKNPGDTVTVEFNRDGKATTVSVTLGSDASSASSSSQQNSGSGGSSLFGNLFGGGSSSNSGSAS